MKSMPRGTRIIDIFEAIENGALEINDIFMAMSMAETAYGTSHHKMQRTMNRLEKERERRRIDARERHAISSSISKLKKQGFIQSPASCIGWLLTKTGKEKMKQLKERLLKHTSYLKEQGVEIIIITFDIPEKYRGDRKWLRSVLIMLDYEPIQKSVFIGKTKIPKAFIHDIHAKGLSSYIHIFSIGKKGTLEDHYT